MLESLALHEICDDVEVKNMSRSRTRQNVGYGSNGYYVIVSSQ